MPYSFLVEEVNKLLREEQGDRTDLDPQEEQPPSGSDPMAQDPNAGMDDGMGGDPSMGGGMDPSMGGMPGQEEPLKPVELNRMYELKKIHSRLVTIENLLSTSEDISSIKIKQVIMQASDLFQHIILNFDQYSERIDEIIIMYYKFLDYLYNTVVEYFKVSSDPDQKIQPKKVEAYLKKEDIE